MPLKLSIGLSKKLGLPDYSSVGASCHVEVELESALIQQDLEAFHRQVRNAYVACAQAVNDELTRHKAPTEGQPAPRPERAGPVKPEPHANGKPAPSNGQASHAASSKQLEYCQQLGGQIKGLGRRGVTQLCDRMFGKPLAELSSLDASGLIDMLKAIKAGDIDIQAAMVGDKVAA